MHVDPDKLAKGIEVLKKMPNKESASCLSVVEEEVLELRDKEYSFREILALLVEHLNLHPALSTLHGFEKRARLRRAKRERLAKKSLAEKKIEPASKQQIQAVTLPVEKLEDTKAIIRALKATAGVVNPGVNNAKFKFIKTEPLITTPKRKD